MTAPRPAHTLIGEAAQLRICQGCRRHVLAARVSGGIILADPSNITILGELTARLQNRGTYDILVNTWPPVMRLRWRGLGQIRRPRIHPIVAEHRCGAEVETAPAPPYQGLPIPRTRPLPEMPPF